MHSNKRSFTRIGLSFAFGLTALACDVEGIIGDGETEGDDDAVQCPEGTHPDDMGACPADDGDVDTSSTTSGGDPYPGTDGCSSTTWDDSGGVSTTGYDTDTDGMFVCPPPSVFDPEIWLCVCPDGSSYDDYTGCPFDTTTGGDPYCMEDTDAECYCPDGTPFDPSIGCAGDSGTSSTSTSG